jgi:hypothetical protein
LILLNILATTRISNGQNPIVPYTKNMFPNPRSHLADYGPHFLGLVVCHHLGLWWVTLICWIPFTCLWKSIFQYSIFFGLVRNLQIWYLDYGKCGIYQNFIKGMWKIKGEIVIVKFQTWQLLPKFPILVVWLFVWWTNLVLLLNQTSSSNLLVILSRWNCNGGVFFGYLVLMPTCLVTIIVHTAFSINGD